jgi:hypothetical protein
VLALHPQLSMLSVAVQPDMLGLVLVTVALLGGVRAIEHPTAGNAAWLGLATGLVLLTKLHLALPLMAVAAIVAVAGVARGHGLGAVRRAGIAGGIAAAVGGWWYLRSWLLFGNAMGLMETGRDTGASDSFLLNLRHFVELRGAEVLRSYWGVWGWLDYGLPHALLPWLGLLAVAPAALLLVGAHMVSWAPPAKSDDAAGDGVNVAGLLVVTLAFALFAAQMIAITGLYGIVNDQGRHWLGYAAVQALYLAAPLLLLTPSRLEAMARWAGAHGRLARVVATALLVAAAGLAFASLATRLPLAVLEVTMRSTVDGAAELYVDSGAGVSGVERERRAVRARDGWVTHAFPLRVRRVEQLRFDPMVHAGAVEVRRVTLRERSGAMREFQPAAITPLHDLAPLELTESGVRLTALPGATDPRAALAFDAPLLVDAGAIARWLDAPRRFLLRAYRRLPLLHTLVLLWPWALFGAGAASAAALLRRRARWTAGGAARLQVAAIVALAAVLLALNVWLMALTWSHYRG